MKTLSRDNTTIAYDITGHGETTLFFVHGSYMDHTWWKNQVSYFKNQYLIVAIDLAGHGQSGRDRKNWTIDGFAEDVVAVIKKENLKNVILIGHSMGGSVNLIATELYQDPIIGFVGIENFKNAGMPMEPERQKQSAELLKKMETGFSDTSEQYARLALLTAKTPAPVTDAVVEAYRNADKGMGIPTSNEMFRMDERERKILPKLGPKLHLINVDYMPTNEAALKDLLIVNFDVRMMHGTSHFPMLEDPDTLNKLLEETIEAISSDTKKLHHTQHQIPS